MNLSHSSPTEVELQWQNGVIEMKLLEGDDPPPAILLVARHPGRPTMGNARFVRCVPHVSQIAEGRPVYREEV